MMQDYHIGSLDEASRLVLKGGIKAEEDAYECRPTFLEPRSWPKAILHSKRSISWNTRIFTFRLEHEEQTLGLPIGQHLLLRVEDPVTKSVLIRPYTPISETTQTGFMEILIKIYFDTKDTAGGVMTKSLDNLPLGHVVHVKGPIGKFEYLGRGFCSIHGIRRKVKKIAMISAGSGITPILQVFRSVMIDDEDQTKCILLDGNRLLEDILCKKDLDKLAARKGNTAKVLYTLTQGPESWKGLRGRINDELIKKYCKRDDDTMILVCGPAEFEKSVRDAFRDQGWTDQEMVFF